MINLPTSWLASRFLPVHCSHFLGLTSRAPGSHSRCGRTGRKTPAHGSLARLHRCPLCPAPHSLLPSVSVPVRAASGPLCPKWPDLPPRTESCFLPGSLEQPCFPGPSLGPVLVHSRPPPPQSTQPLGTLLENEMRCILQTCRASSHTIQAEALSRSRDPDPGLPAVSTLLAASEGSGSVDPRVPFLEAFLLPRPHPPPATDGRLHPQVSLAQGGSGDGRPPGHPSSLVALKNRK